MGAPQLSCTPTNVGCTTMAAVTSATAVNLPYCTAGAASGGPGPQVAPGVVLLEDDPFERELAANDNSSMVETERDRLIRLVRHINCSQGRHG